MKNKILILSTILFLFLILILFFPLNKKHPSISFYHWQNSFNPSNKELNDLKNLNTQKIYLKIYDISFKEKLEYVETKIDLKSNFEIIPVIYIENNVFKKTRNMEVFTDKLVNTISSKIKKLNTKEIQFDLDWSPSTKEKYFKFLKTIKQKLKVKLSCTIRLHQVKYFQKTGIPPVDRGILMYYNMSDITDINSNNYIIDNTIAKNYYYNFDKYPLILDVALPIYSEIVVFRYEQIVQLIEKVKKEDLENDNFIKIDENRYKVLNSHYFKGSYLYNDDVVRFEDSSKKELLKAAYELSKLLRKAPKEVIFYRLDGEYIDSLGYDGFKDIIREF